LTLRQAFDEPADVYSGGAEHLFSVRAVAFAERLWTKSMRATSRLLIFDFPFHPKVFLAILPWRSPVSAAQCSPIGFTEWPHQNQTPTKFRG